MEKYVANTLEGLFSLEGRVGIITGASSGIGLAVSTLLADAGAKVYDLSRTLRDNPQHQNITRIQADITNIAIVKEIVREIAGKEGHIDFLINNAGTTHKCRAEVFPEEKWDSIVATNLDAVFKISQALFPYLTKSQYIGRIVNISSMAGHLGFSEVVPYCSTKSGVIGLTHGLAVEWVNDNILVNSVAPGWFPSQMSVKVMDDERKAKILNRMAMHRFGDTKDIASMVLFLLSNAATYITGQDFAVDGGALALGF
jgi:NAD(P)-dependent dehydrogenase (short-subunit alcohol dehydrogenase family)